MLLHGAVFKPTHLLSQIRKKMRVSIRRILRKHGFPPDLQSDAIKKVVQQAEVLAREIA